MTPADREWQKAITEHATAVLHAAVGAGLDLTPQLRPSRDQGGATVEIQGPDGGWRRFYVRLTPCAR